MFSRIIFISEVYYFYTYTYVTLNFLNQNIMSIFAALSYPIAGIHGIR